MPNIGQSSKIFSPTQMGTDTVLTGNIKNGEIKDEDIAGAAAIAMSKLALAITNNEVAAGAAIVDTKLGTISTAGKVSGAALTSLASIPAGAGVIPTANLPTVIVFKNGDTTKDASDASGTQNIAHGLGKVPAKVKITAIGEQNSGGSNNYMNLSVSVYNGTTQSSVSRYASAADGSVVNIFRIGLGTNSNYQTGVITFDATNIIITWTKTNSPTGVFTLIWEAEG